VRWLLVLLLLPGCVGLHDFTPDEPDVGDNWTYTDGERTMTVTYVGPAATSGLPYWDFQSESNIWMPYPFDHIEPKTGGRIDGPTDTSPKVRPWMQWSGASATVEFFGSDMDVEVETRGHERTVTIIADGANSQSTETVLTYERGDVLPRTFTWWRGYDSEGFVDRVSIWQV
jgi:hypothetical protein